MGNIESIDINIIWCEVNKEHTRGDFLFKIEWISEKKHNNN